jgi:hypothetical protein
LQRFAGDPGQTASVVPSHTPTASLCLSPLRESLTAHQRRRAPRRDAQRQHGYQRRGQRTADEVLPQTQISAQPF